MRKLIFAAGTIAILAAAFVVVQRARPSPLPAQSQASQAIEPRPQSDAAIPLSSTSCNGTYSGTFSGNLTVSNGQSCDFIAGGANGNVTLTGGQLLLSNAKISGNVQGSGNLMLSGTARVTGNMTLTGGQVSLGSGASVGGNLTLTGAVPFSIGPSATVTGNVQISNLPAGSGQDSICSSQVQGNLQFTNSGISAAIGSSQPSCAGNAIRGNLQVENNTAATAIDGNAVGGNLQVENNTASTEILNNTIGGNLQCENNGLIAVGVNTAKQTQGQCVSLITWSVPQVTFFLLPGDIGLRTVAFTSSVPISNATLVPTPEIAPFLTLVPAAITSVSANSSQPVQIQATIPAGTPASSTYAGTIQVKSGSQIITQVLKVIIMLAPPPDPGAAGMATLAGIDSDGDGIRDDVQRWIDLTYPSSAKTRAALSQQARAIQVAILLSANKSQAMAAINAEIGGSLCLAGLLSGGALAAGNMSDQLDSIAINTPARMAAYLTSNSFMSGTAGGLPSIASRTSFCAFNPNALPD